MQQHLKRVRKQDSLNRRLDTGRKQTLSVSSPLSRHLVILARVFCHRISYPLLKLRCSPVQTRNNVPRWLSLSNVKNDLHTCQLEHMPGSCGWFLEAPYAQDYLNSKQSTTIRLKHRPGADTTILASFLVKYFSDQTDNHVLYLFCQAFETEKQETTHV